MAWWLWWCTINPTQAKELPFSFIIPPSFHVISQCPSMRYPMKTALSACELLEVLWTIKLTIFHMEVLIVELKDGAAGYQHVTTKPV